MSGAGLTCSVGLWLLGVPGLTKVEPVRITESSFTSLNSLRAVENFRINQLCPLGRRAGRVICIQSFQKGLIMALGIAHVVGGAMGIFTCGVIIQQAHSTLFIAKCFTS